jgi:phosphatidylserine decarboxylase
MKRFPIDPEGVKFCWLVLVPMLLAIALGWWCVTTILLLLLIIMLGFFRDPRREIPQSPEVVVSPADGKIDTIYTNEDPEAGPVGGQVIGIFLSVFNVHVNRAPFAGVVERVHYVPGKFLDARAEDCAKCNEANWIYLRSGRHQITVRQIAGLIARRIVCRVDVGQSLRKGQRIGMIRFGSRTELYLPPAAEVLAREGDIVKGGLSVLATLPVEETTE